MKKAKYLAVSAIVLFGNALSAFAQAGSEISGMLTSGGESLKKNVGTFIGYAEIFLVISGVISVVWAFLDRKDQSEGPNKRLMTVGVSMLVGFVILLVLGSIINSIRISAS